ncbi:DNA topoisomerase [Lipomyces oligophaga]|uniref:DNA topoisomerase n=1 Tax=Lipomyces oligophaga TaxID=45792 RepID=UPI0034CD90D7
MTTVKQCFVYISGSPTLTTAVSFFSYTGRVSILSPLWLLSWRSCAIYHPKQNSTPYSCLQQIRLFSRAQIPFKTMARGAISFSSSEDDDDLEYSPVRSAKKAQPPRRAASEAALVAARKRSHNESSDIFDFEVPSDDDDFQLNTPPKKVKLGSSAVKKTAVRASAAVTAASSAAKPDVSRKRGRPKKIESIDSDSDLNVVAGEPKKLATAPKTSKRAAKPLRQATLFDDDDNDDYSMDQSNDDGDSDVYEPVSPPPRAAGKPATKPIKSTAAKTTGTKRAPAKARTKSAAPLMPLESNLDLHSPVATATKKNVLNFDDSFSIDSSDLVPGPISPVVPTATSTPAPSKSKTSSETYQKLTQLEHILKRPDTYIGSVEYTERMMWTFDSTTKSMVYKNVRFVPGIYKIFDEILVNAADNKIRDPNMDSLKVKIDKEANQITIYNNGKGIPIEMHSKEQMYIPELIFGNLLTSSNYDDDEKKVTGGRNGYGAKLCNIFSTSFTIETADRESKQAYKQIWSDNMSKVSKPKITKNSKGDQYTRIIFNPDLRLFGMSELDDDLIGIMMRRVYDLAGSVKKVKVYLNDERLKITGFKQYMEMYVTALSAFTPEIKQEVVKGESDDDDFPPLDVKPTVPTGPPPTIITEVVNDRWEIGFAVSDGNFNQVSFVNSIATTSGGTHVNYICDQIVTKLTESLKKKSKSSTIRPQQIRNNIFLFVNCLIENPAFTSQTKEQLTTRPSAFGSKCIPSDNFFKKVANSSIIESIMDIATMNADKQLKKTDGSKRNRITGLVKLDDANKAGTREGHKCTLILTEGDSAKALAVAGLSVVGRDYYGVYPLRGKILNVREASSDQILKNAEIQAIKQIMGLQHKKHYSSTKDLRYGHLMIFTDQDHDGSHIKGLLINFLESTFPGLLEIPGFLIEFITPIVKVTIGKGKKPKIIPFYTMPEYEQWKDNEGRRCTWTHKYYKGLGTSSPEEGREYFRQLDRHLKEFHAIQDDDKFAIDLAFSKKKADDRKEWLRNFKPGTYLDPSIPKVPIEDFINKELILFSMADNMRSIPSIVDGLKPAQRKILFACFKRNLEGGIKVSQLAGYASEVTAYHHGEQSLVPTIVGMAQDFVGSNNLNVLLPKGIFGTRATGGKDASAPRYIYTALNPITRKVFHLDDDPILNYLTEEEARIEPEYYVPILPMVLVNGAEGIGTGWSTSIPCYNPLDLVNNIRRLMKGELMKEMEPWYRGWSGTTERLSADKFKVSGIANQVSKNTIEITELPVRQWTVTTKEFLLAGMAGSEKVKPWIKDMIEQHKMDIKFVVTLSDEEMQKSLDEGLLNRFRLTSTINLGNMVAFDGAGRIKKYDSAEDILKDFYFLRLDYYQRRKLNLTETLTQKMEKLNSQARFVKMIIDKELTVSNRRRAEIVLDLKKKKFPPISKKNKFGPVEESEIGKDEEEDDDVEASSYDYLLGMAIWSLTRERYEKLLRERDAMETELNILLKKTAKDLWSHDLNEFEKTWNQNQITYKTERPS